MNKFLFRKVLALVVAAIAVIAVYFYTETTIQSEIAPTKIVVATGDIPPHTEIKPENVIMIEVPGKALPQNHTYASKVEDVVGKWTVEGYGVHAKGFVNMDKLLPKSELPDSGLLELQEGEYAFSTQVDLETSHGNTIRPGTKVDLYLSATFSLRDLSPNMIKSQGWNDSEEFMDDRVYYFGRVAVEARVIEVKDNRGNKVFTPDDYTNSDQSQKASNKQQMAKLYTLAVDLEDLQLLNKAQLFGKVVPVVSGTSYNELDLDITGIDTDNKPTVMSDIQDTIKVIEGVTLNPSKID